MTLVRRLPMSWIRWDTAQQTLALEIYAKKMDRQRDTGVKVDALIREPEMQRLEARASV
jgi:hypothetical protein